jgi:hypothetical protein
MHLGGWLFLWPSLATLRCALFSSPCCFPHALWLFRMRAAPSIISFNIILPSTPTSSQPFLHFLLVSPSKPPECHIPRTINPPWYDHPNDISRSPPWRCGLTQANACSFLRFLDHTQRRTTLGRKPLDEWSARRRELYLTTHNTHNRQTSTPTVGFEPTISAGERQQIYVLDRAALGPASGDTQKYILFSVDHNHAFQTFR